MQTRHSIGSFALLLFVTECCTGLLHAQPTQRDTSTQKAAAPVVVTTTRPFTAASDSRFRAEDLRLLPRSSAQDLLRIVPGLVIAQHAGGGKAEQIFLRGFDCDHGTDVNVTVDDAPVNMISHGHGQGYADLHFIIPELVDRIDVVKGPYYARYGDLTTAGAVAFRTADTLSENLVRLEGGQFNTFRGVALLRTSPLGSGVSAYFGGELYGTDGYFRAAQDYRRQNLFGKVFARMGDGGSFSASISGFSSGWNASGQVPERAVAAGEIDRFGAIDSLEGGVTSRTTTTLRYTSGGESPLTLTASLTDYRFRLFSDFTFFLRDSVRGDMIEQTDDRTVTAVRAQQQISYGVGDAAMLTRVGATLRNDDIAAALYQDSARTRLATVRNNRIRERQLGSYVEQEIELPWISVQLGARADYFTYDVENAEDGDGIAGVRQQLLVSPKANVAVPVMNDLTLFLNSGFGFHSNDARVVVGSSADSTIPRAFGAEFGARYGTPNSVVSAALALWQLDLESEQVYIGDEGTTEPSGRTRRRGIDVEVRVRPTDWLAFGVDATFSQGRLRDEPEGADFIPLAPSMTLVANAAVRFTDLAVALRLRVVDDRPANEDNSVVAKGYGILDLTASYRVTPQIELLLMAENILDAEWNEAQFDTESRLRTEPGPVSELHFTPGTPRSIRGGLAFHF